MKIRYEFIDDDSEEIVFRVKQINSKLIAIQKIIETTFHEQNQLLVYKNQDEYFIPLKDILYFESYDQLIYAHTVNDLFVSKYKLYELEQLLPDQFQRISKSAIANINEIFALKKSFSGTGTIAFRNSEKTIHISRQYLNDIKDKLYTWRVLK